jgi:fluoride exporter
VRLAAARARRRGSSEVTKPATASTATPIGQANHANRMAASLGNVSGRGCAPGVARVNVGRMGKDQRVTEHVPPPMDADVDLHRPADRAEMRPSPIPVLAAVSAGGVLGALARYGLARAWPHPADGFPWSTFVINVTGCLLIGVLMVIVTEVVPQRRLVRPFFGVGVLGGYTTFSTYIVDVHKASAAGAPWIALGYLAGTLVAALLAVTAGSAVTSLIVRRWVR